MFMYIFCLTFYTIIYPHYHIFLYISIVKVPLMRHSLTFSIWPSKCQFSAVGGSLFNLKAHCGTVLSLLDGRDVHLKGQCCPICLLKVKIKLQ